MKKVCMILADGFEEVEALGTYGILVRGGLSVDLCALSDQNTTGRFGVTCARLKPLSAVNKNDYDALVLPGGPGHTLLKQSSVVRALITSFIEQDKVVAAICASPVILGEMGYLKGKNYTCFTSMNADFGGTYHEDYTVTDGNLITGKSAAASIDFGFAIVQKLCGADAADKTKQQIYYKG